MPDPTTVPTLTPELARKLARLAMAGIEREYPCKPADVLQTAADVRPQREVHPVFYGCFDWHSSVHSHWVLARLLKVGDLGPVASEARGMLARQLTYDKLAAEAAYFDDPKHQAYERMYGWAWLLRLAAELAPWQDADAARWSAALAPLAGRLVELIHGYLPRLNRPIRTGVHADTAFALAQTFDYAQTVGDDDLAARISQYAVEHFRDDSDYPAAFEPSGEDFFSPAWNEADLMRRVLPKAEFAGWLARFLPGLAKGVAPGLKPATVSDLTDGKLVHLVGLNLSRAWTQRGVLKATPQGDARRKVLAASADAHTTAGTAQVFSGHYEGEHWLGTFAVYLLTRPDADQKP